MAVLRNIFTSEIPSNLSIRTVQLNEFILLIFLLSCIGFAYCNKYYKKYSDKYKELRLDVANLVQNENHREFCKHEQTCDCINQYVEYMKDVHDIDVLLK
ncbi:hypothetical protein bsdtb5_10330 [Anaeromicropila herbilytica]|uniref:Uncharacterized protein n=2 Tax=Anaeromicropila herbilytica TaxID=2785025 RepID=A0A7R7ID76_9FIRM|nr:hypothetical protein bsdtb5_10330 [Anaeromicropila herbilytica]